MPAPTNYQQMLTNAQNSYSGILAGYQKALSGQQAAQKNVVKGYNTLSANVLGGLEGIGASRSQEIADYYSQQAGAANQQLVNRGLGNTTVASSVGRGLTLDQAKAQTQLQNLLAGQRAQYQTQLGLAGLGYQGQAIGQNAALQGAALGYQGNWQRALLGAGMQGAALDQQYQLGMSRGGGGGYIGGGVGGTQYSPGGGGRGFHTPDSSTSVDDAIDFNAGMYGGGYGISNGGMLGGAGNYSTYTIPSQNSGGSEWWGEDYGWVTP